MIARVLAAVVGLLVILPAILWGGEIAVEVIVLLAMWVGFDEWSRMAFPEDQPAAFGWLVLTGTALYATPLYLAPLFPGSEVVGLSVAVVALATFGFAVARPGPSLKRGLERLGLYFVGLLWIAGLLVFLPLLRRLDQGLVWVFLVLVIPWAGDTGAYFAGRALGRHKLAPRISPKKTWEGFFGGLVAAVAGVFVVRIFAPSLTVLDCLVLGVGLGSAAVLGDLAESLLKRALEVKDSGWILPGHGGILDRIDSLLFVAPLLYAYAILSA